MIKKAAISLTGVFWVVSAISTPQSPVDRLIVDTEFCAYMASPPENDSETFLARYQAAMRAAVLFIRQENPRMTDTQALFEIKAKCDVALLGLIHYK